MFKKLRNKMLLFTMVSISLVLLLAFAIIYFITYSSTERENQRHLQAMASIALLPNRPFPGQGTLRPQMTESFGADYRVSFILFTKEGELLEINSHLDFDDQIYEEALQKTTGQTAGKISLNGREWAYQVFNAPTANAPTANAPNTNTPTITTNNTNADNPTTDTSPYQRIVFLDITTSEAQLLTLLKTLLGTSVAVLLLILVLSYRFAVWAVRPIEESYQKQKQFVADASHEFKTPLAVISANIDAIEASADEPVKSQQEWFGYIHQELGRATTLVDDLLFLAKAEETTLAPSSPFNLSQVCEEVCASSEALLYERNITLQTVIPEEVIAQADGEKIKQVLYILMDNASKYTPEHGHITCQLRQEEGQAVILVTNTGDGIKEEDLTRIFDRFYRPDSSRSQETGGFGLGLSIAKTIVERSGGKIEAESNPQETRFTIHLKLA